MTEMTLSESAAWGDVSHEGERHIFGRETAIDEVSAHLASHRLVTIVGSGGTGKSTLARACARQLGGRHAEGARFVELSTLIEASLLGSALATALGIEFSMGNTIPQVLSHLRSRDMLLVLDGCEHIGEEVARLIEQLCTLPGGVRVLVTSREPLLAFGEKLYRLAGIEFPLQPNALSAKEALAFPSVQFLLSRAGKGGRVFEVDDRLARVAGSIAKRLEGVPLALELAAARAAHSGLDEVFEQIDFKLMSLGIRDSSLPLRHQTLTAVLDWSYDLLADEERQILCRLSVFCGDFDLDAALAVCKNTGLAESDIAGIVLDLVSKSLLSSLRRAGSMRYRMLDTTRSYAVDKSRADGTLHETRDSHASYLLEVLRSAEGDWTLLDREAWRNIYAAWIPDVRSALSWTFHKRTDWALAVELTVLAFPLSDHTGLLVEYRDYVVRALSINKNLQLDWPLAYTQLQTFVLIDHMRQPQKDAQLQHQALAALEIARSSGEARYQIAPMLALWGQPFQAGHYPEALLRATEMGSTARACKDKAGEATADRILAQCQHYLGNHIAATEAINRVNLSVLARIPLMYAPSPVEPVVSLGILRARILWLTGFPDQAMECIESILVKARRGSVVGLCQALAMAAVPIALWNNDRTAALSWSGQLAKLQEEFSYAYWTPWSDLFQRVLPENSHGAHVDEFLSTVGERHHSLRDHASTFGLMYVSTESVERCRGGCVGWCAPEVFRVAALRTFSTSQSSAAETSEALQQSCSIAASQGAVSWELRSAMSMVEHSSNSRSLRSALCQLEATFRRFKEGFETADLLKAAGMLDSLS
ncbi:MAG: NB-ARC domain-containing protein [Hydrogenophaga sp.]|nr:NB-ARC domain-containing protein [Hydrogenophaga sp.]